MSPSSSAATPAIHTASSPAQQPVVQRQMSSNNNSRPTTPQTARSREPRQRKDRSPHPSVSVKNATNTSNDTTTPQSAMEARSKPNKPLPTASQLKQLENADSSSERPRGVITLPTTTTTKRDPVESPRPRNARVGRNREGHLRLMTRGRLDRGLTNSRLDSLNLSPAESTLKRTCSLPEIPRPPPLLPPPLAD